MSEPAHTSSGPRPPGDRLFADDSVDAAADGPRTTGQADPEAFAGEPTLWHITPHPSEPAEAAEPLTASDASGVSGDDAARVTEPVVQSGAAARFLAGRRPRSASGPDSRPECGPSGAETSTTTDVPHAAAADERDGCPHPEDNLPADAARIQFGVNEAEEQPDGRVRGAASWSGAVGGDPAAAILDEVNATSSEVAVGLGAASAVATEEDEAELEVEGTPLFTLDSGWLYLLSGLALLAAAVVLPPHDALKVETARRDAYLLHEEAMVARLDAYAEFMMSLDAEDPELVRRLAAANYRRVPAQSTPIAMFPDGLNPSVDAWIDATLPPPTPPTPPDLADSWLRRMATGPDRLWFISGAFVLMAIGLILTSAGPLSATDDEDAVRPEPA